MSGTEGAQACGRLEVQYAHGPEAGCEPPAEAEVRRLLGAALPEGAAVTVRFVGAGESRELNSRHLGKDRPANVLAFPDPDAGGASGDVAICPEVVAREAEESGVPARERFAHLVVHAALHLRGMDHDTPAAAGAMEGEERRLLAGLGYPDPYG